MRLGEINIIGADLTRMRAFYCDLLGLEAVEREGADALHCRLGEARFLLLAVASGSAPAEPYPTRPTISFDLVANDLAELCERLDEAGAEFVRRSDGRSAIVRDPDGNAVELLQATPGAAPDASG